MLVAFQRRLTAQGRARKGRLAYGYQMRSILKVAERLTGRATTCSELIQDAGLLGRVLVDDTAPTLGTQVSRWTLAQRRSAIRAFVTLMRPELVGLLGSDPHRHLDRALRAVAERVGAGYRLNGGAPRRRGGRTPSDGQIRDVLDAVGQAPGYLGLRNRAFFLILAQTGSRINALRQLDGADCVAMPCPMSDTARSGRRDSRVGTPSRSFSGLRSVRLAASSVALVLRIAGVVDG